MHGERAQNRQTGREYWKSRLHKGGEATGRQTKRWTHRKERRESRRIEKEAFKNPCYAGPERIL